MMTVIQLYQEISKVLTADELEVLLQYIIDQRPYADIGHVKTKYYKPKTTKQKQRVRNRDKTAGYRKVKSILRKLKTINVSKAMYEALLSEPSKVEDGVPKHYIGWLCTRLQAVNDGGYWKYPQKKKTVYKSKSICQIPQYLANAFPTKTKCSLCGIKCTRKDLN